MSQHTPGPWRLKDANAIMSDVGEFIAVTSFQIDTEREKANARLITAAPDLLAALKKCVRVFEQLADAGNYPLPLFQNGGWKFAADAIAKAYDAALTCPRAGAEVMPKRIQRKRTRGWKMPEGAVYVGRPTKWGNPFVVGKPGGAFSKKVLSQRHAWQLYRSVAIDNEKLIAAAQKELRGKDLACFCPLPTEPYEPDCCHAAVLLEIANAPERETDNG